MVSCSPKVSFPRGLHLDGWGPPAWFTLHMFAHTAPLQLQPSERDEIKSLLRSFGRHLPCPTCRVHFCAYLDAHMTDECMSTREGIVALLNDCHNEVNRRKGRRTYDLQEHHRLIHGDYSSSSRPFVSSSPPLALYTVVILGVCVLLIAQKSKMRNCSE